MKNKYDAISVGSGLGGLTAAARFAREGKKVLVLERHSSFGGAATMYSRHKIKIEVGLHETCGLNSRESGDYIYDTLGLRDKLKFISTGSFFRVEQKTVKDGFVMPIGKEQAVTAIKKKFPQHAKSVDKYFRILSKIRRSIYRMNEFEIDRKKLLLSLYKLPTTLWPLIRYEKITLGELLQELFADDEAIKLVLCANLCYYTDDPYKLSLIFFAVAQDAYHCNGSCFIQGGSEALSNQLINIIEEAGGCIQSRRNVTEILMEGKQIIGVRHEKASIINGQKKITKPDLQTIYAPLIFGNAAPTVLAKLLPEVYQKDFMKPYHDLKSSTSLWSLYLAFDCSPKEFGVTEYSTFIFPEWADKLADSKEFASLLNNMPNGRTPGFVFASYSHIDSGIDNESSVHTATMLGLDQLSNWNNLSEKEYQLKKEAWMETLIVELDCRYPGIKKTIIYKEMGTARTMKSYMNTPDGAVYGFAQTPQQAGRHRPQVKSPVDGLLIASAWGMPGGGYTGAMWGGIKAAEEAIKENW